jgi:hypothetical protein
MIDNVNTYNGLVKAIQQWTNRNDSVFIENIPLFISLAEQQFFIDCSTLGNEFYVTTVFTANNESLPKPVNWGETLTISYIGADGKIVVLKRVSYELIRSFAPANNISTNSTTTPRYYSDYGYDYFIISPTPVAAYPVEIAYFGKTQMLSSINQTNWITKNAYDALLWSCLNKASQFIDNTVDAAAYLSMYTDRIQAINTYNKGRKSDRASDTMKD